MLAGRLKAIWRYPIKSLRSEQLAETDVREDGLPGDRGASLIVTSEHARMGKAYRGKEHERLHLTHDPAEAALLASDRGISVRLTDHGADHDYDAAPISVIFDRWLDGLSEHAGYPVEHERFRPNFFVEAVPSFGDTEAALVGRTISIGDVSLAVKSTIGRCVAVTYHPDGEPSDARILKYVALERANVMGVYCDVVRAGHVRAEMPVHITP
jgi:uncharacterized protein YcbX